MSHECPQARPSPISTARSPAHPLSPRALTHSLAHSLTHPYPRPLPPTGDAKHFIRNLFHYISTATRQQLIADNLDWILFWEWSAYDELSKVSEGVTDGPGGPVIIGPPRSAGDMHAEGLLFVRAGYEGPYDINPNAMAGWAALNTMLLARGALDGYYIIPTAPNTRHGMYFKPFVLPVWAMHLPDSNNYNGVLHWHNYIMRGTIWRQSSGGRSIFATNNQLRAMYVRRQRAINATDLPSRQLPPILALPAAATNPLLPSRLIAVAIAPP